MPEIITNGKIRVPWSFIQTAIIVLFCSGSVWSNVRAQAAIDLNTTHRLYAEDVLVPDYRDWRVDVTERLARIEERQIALRAMLMDWHRSWEQPTPPVRRTPNES